MREPNPPDLSHSSRKEPHHENSQLILSHRTFRAPLSACSPKSSSPCPSEEGVCRHALKLEIQEVTREGLDLLSGEGGSKEDSS